MPLVAHQSIPKRSRRMKTPVRAPLRMPIPFRRIDRRTHSVRYSIAMVLVDAALRSHRRQSRLSGARARKTLHLKRRTREI